jgi:hypothetical protein
LAIPAHEEPAAAEHILGILQTDEQVRQQYAAAGHDRDAVARVIAQATGRDVAASNLDGMGTHLRANKADEIAQLANDYPALNVVADGTGA